MARNVFVEINLDSARTTDQLHDLLRDRLGFPGWYGKNWDAFLDSISGLIEMPEELRFIGWNSFNHRLPIDAGLMKSCLDQMSQELPELSSRVEYV
jgi:ribonuclease inhibitor